MVTSCDKPLFPPAVITSVNEQMEQFNPQVADQQTSFPETMRLKPCLRNAALRESILFEVDVDHEKVTERNALRGGEAVRRHSGKHGSICFVVRRPGTFIRHFQKAKGFVVLDM